MGMSARERIGSRRLLELLESADLFSLAGTVTHRKSTACTRAEAIDTILQYSLSAYELLNRRKVLRDIIAAYLKNEGVPIPSKVTKADMVLKTLTHWSKPDFSVTDVRTFTPSSTSQQSKASGYNTSHPSSLYTSESPIHSPLEESSKTRKSKTLTVDLDDIITAVSHIQVRDRVSSPPIRTQEKVSNESDQMKVSRDGLSAIFDISKMSKSSCLKEEGKELRSASQPQIPQAGIHITTSSMQTERKLVKTEPKTEKDSAASCRGAMYDTKHRVPSSTVTKEKKEKLRPLPSPVSGAGIHIATQSMQTERTLVKTEPKTEKDSATSCRGDMYDTKHRVPSSTVTKEKKEKLRPLPSPVSGQNSRSDSQRPALHQSANEKRHSKEMTSLSSNEVEDAPWICPVDYEQFAKDFCEWFYTVLNSQQQSSRQQRKDWGPQHFMEDAELQLTYMSARRRCTGGTSTSSHLLALVQEKGLFFQPNISKRYLKCERSPQGSVVVMVSGTIFRNKSYLGTFDQVFKVVGNSKTNNWKIQNVDLKIQ